MLIDDGVLQLPALPTLISAPPSIDHTPTLGGYWSLPSPLSFENVGFSRNTRPPATNAPSTSVVSTTAPPAQVKYLICADCDHGPLGWHDTEGRDLGLEVAAENEGADAPGGEGAVRRGREFLIDVGRVRYAPARTV